MRNYWEKLQNLETDYKKNRKWKDKKRGKRCTVFKIQTVSYFAAFADCS